MDFPFHGKPSCTWSWISPHAPPALCSEHTSLPCAPSCKPCSFCAVSLPKMLCSPFFFLTPLVPHYLVISPQSFLREPFPDLSAKARSPSLLITGDMPLKHTSELAFYTCVIVWSRFISLTGLSSIRTGIIPGFAYHVSRAQPKAWHMVYAQWKRVGEWNEDSRIYRIFCFMKVYPQSPWFTSFHR